MPITERKHAYILDYGYLWGHLSSVLVCMVMVYYSINLLTSSHALTLTSPGTNNANKRENKDHFFQQILFANMVVLKQAQQRHAGVIQFSLGINTTGLTTQVLLNTHKNVIKATSLLQ